MPACHAETAGSNPVGSAISAFSYAPSARPDGAFFMPCEGRWGVARRARGPLAECRKREARPRRHPRRPHRRRGDRVDVGGPFAFGGPGATTGPSMSPDTGADGSPAATSTPTGAPATTPEPRPGAPDPDARPLRRRPDRARHALPVDAHERLRGGGRRGPGGDEQDLRGARARRGGTAEAILGTPAWSVRRARTGSSSSRMPRPSRRTWPSTASVSPSCGPTTDVRQSARWRGA